MTRPIHSAGVLCRHSGWLWGIALVTLVGCVQLKPNPYLASIYETPAQHNRPDRNPVIVIPGILGTTLVYPQTQTMVWGAFGGDSVNPERPDGARMLALPMGVGRPFKSLKDSVIPDGALERFQVSLWGLPVFLNAYVHILSTLGSGGFIDEQLVKANALDYGDDHFTCFQFDYDWRRDNVENAKRLHGFIEEKKTQVQEEIQRRFEIEDYDVKFDIVAHSMGGLITRYYLRYGAKDLPADGSNPTVTWAGAEHVSRAILVGTPNAGSQNALYQLVHGTRFAMFLPGVAPAILGTMPSVYQLMPRGRHKTVTNDETGEPLEDLFDPSVWQKMRWGLASQDQDEVLAMLLPAVKDPTARRKIALDHQRKCLLRARQFTEALDTPVSPPDGLELYLFAGDAEPTASHARFDPATGKLWISGTSPGDGTVTRDSATMDERLGRPWTPRLQSPVHWRQVFFIFNDHLGMTQDDAFSDNVLYLLLEDSRQ